MLKRKITVIHLLLLFTIILINGCNKKDKTDDNTPKEMDIYLAGYKLDPSQQSIVYAKNGEISSYITYSSNPSYHYASMNVANNKIYILATEQKNSELTATYFVDKVKTSLASTNTTIALNFAVKGNDVIVAGREYIGGKYKAKVWNNSDVLYTLTTDTDDYPADIKLEGNDIYVLANERNGSKYTKMKIWKNNTLHASIDNGGQSLIANRMWIQNNDTYIGGNYLDIVSNKTVAAYWKNGTLNKIKQGTNNSDLKYFSVSNNSPQGIITELSDDNIYLTISYWKNNETKAFVLPADQMVYLSSTEYRGDIYTLMFKTTPSGGEYKIFKNGELYTEYLYPTTSNIDLYDILIVDRP